MQLNGPTGKNRPLDIVHALTPIIPRRAKRSRGILHHAGSDARSCDYAQDDGMGHDERPVRPRKTTGHHARCRPSAQIPGPRLTE
jgi:hypothetical protein